MEVSPLVGGQWIPHAESRQETERRTAGEANPWMGETMTDESKAVAVREPTDVLRPEATFVDLVMLGETLVKTGFLPREVNSGAKAAAIILTGRELGIGPMQSLRSVSIINGKPVLAADLQLGLFHRAGGKSHFVELTAEKVTLELTAPWLTSAHRETFSMEDAKRANLTRNAVWTQYPKAMLRSRVITAGLKSVGFLPCAGMYDPEEMGGAAVIEGQVVETTPVVGTTTDAPAPVTETKPEEPPPTADDTVAVRMRLTMALKAPCFRTDRWRGELRKRLDLPHDATINDWLKNPRRSMQELMDAEMVVEELANAAAGEKEAGQTRTPLGIA